MVIYMDPSKVVPGDEIVFLADGKEINGVVVCRNKQDGSLITADGLAVISSIKFWLSGNKHTDFLVTSEIYTFLSQHKMVITRVNDLRIGECVLIFDKDLKKVRTAIVSLLDPGRNIAFDNGGTPIDPVNSKITSTGLFVESENISAQGHRLLSDCTAVE